jgi:hypothetical protein
MTAAGKPGLAERAPRQGLVARREVVRGVWDGAAVAEAQCVTGVVRLS